MKKFQHTVKFLVQIIDRCGVSLNSDEGLFSISPVKISAIRHIHRCQQIRYWWSTHSHKNEKQNNSTFSRVSNIFAQAKRCNITYEQKLLAMVCVLLKFQFYIYGRITKLFTGITLFPSCSSDGLNQWGVFKSFVRESKNVRTL